MIPSRPMGHHILCIAGPTASGKSSRAVTEALARNGEVISVDSRQVYRGLDVGTEKITAEEMCGVPHHLLDIRDVSEPYSAGEFAADARGLIEEISRRGKLPILAGGSHFYFDALLKGLPPQSPQISSLRASLETLSNEELLARIRSQDPRRAAELDSRNQRRLIRTLEILASHTTVPRRAEISPSTVYDTEWIVVDLPGEDLRTRIDARLSSAFARGLLEEVRRVREAHGDQRLNELGLEYRVIGEFLRGEREESSLLPALSSKLWQYARRQKAWLRKLRTEHVITEVV